MKRLLFNLFEKAYWVLVLAFLIFSIFVMAWEFTMGIFFYMKKQVWVLGSGFSAPYFFMIHCVVAGLAAM